MLQQRIQLPDFPGFPGYGCYIASLITLLEKFLKKPYPNFAQVYGEVVNKGYILHNSLPIGQAGWYRCYARKPALLFNLFAKEAGLSHRIKTIIHSPTPGPDFVLICYNTPGGYHFCLGNSNGTKTHDPDPSVLTKGVNSYRVFGFEA